jgi:hypothetical protein
VAGVHDHPGGLVEGDQVGVGVNDGQAEQGRRPRGRGRAVQGGYPARDQGRGA